MRIIYVADKSLDNEHAVSVSSKPHLSYQVSRHHDGDDWLKSCLEQEKKQQVRHEEKKKKDGFCCVNRFHCYDSVSLDCKQVLCLLGPLLSIKSTNTKER